MYFQQVQTVSMYLKRFGSSTAFSEHKWKKLRFGSSTAFSEHKWKKLPTFSDLIEMLPARFVSLETQGIIYNTILYILSF
jgi:hypothetical protein